MEERRRQWLSAIAACSDEASLRQVQSRLFGKKGEVLELVRSVPSLPKEERPQKGKAYNLLKQEVEAALQARADELRQQGLSGELQGSDFDPTEPGPRPLAGALHPITVVQN